MKNLILIPFLALVGCANTSTIQIEPESFDVIFSEGEYNDHQELSTVLNSDESFDYQVVGTIHYGDIDYITNVLPTDAGATIHVTLDISYPAGTFAAIFTKDSNGEEQMVWTRLARGVEEVYFTVPEGCIWWDLRLAGSSLYTKEYLWRAEVEVL